MAIKIIKNTMEEPIEMECENCKSVLEYNYQDIRVIKKYNLFGCEFQDRVVRCPVCQWDNVLALAKAEYKVKSENSGNVAQDY